jgi:hypothetical protein
VFLLLLGLVIGAVFGRVMAGNADTTAAQAPTVTVTAGPGADPGLTPNGDFFGPPESLQDLAELPPFSGRVKDKALAQAGEGSSGGGSGDGSGSGSVSGSGSGGSGAVGGDGSGTVDAGALDDFTMRASVQGAPILIGEPRVLEVRVTNPNREPITLDTITVVVRQPSPAGCLPQWFDVSDYVRGSGPAVVVAAGGSRIVELELVLENLPTTNQNACQGASLPLALSGTART